MGKSTLIIASFFGILVNAFFYFIAFQNMGFEFWIISGAITITFSVAEVALWINKTPALFILFKLGLLAFSIHTTQAGQSFASSQAEIKRQTDVLTYIDTDQQIEELKEELEEYSIENQLAELNIYQSQMEELDYQAKNLIWAADKTTEEDRIRIDEDKEAVREYMDNINNKYESNRNRINNKISELREERRISGISSTAPRDVYDFYSDKYGIDKEEVKSWSHLLTAMLLAIIAPACLYVFRKYDEPTKASKSISLWNKLKNLVVNIIDKEKQTPPKKEEPKDTIKDHPVPEIVESRLHRKEEPPQSKMVADHPKSVNVFNANRKEVIKKRNIILILYSKITKGESKDLLTIKECYEEFKRIKRDEQPALNIPTMDEIADVLTEIIDKNLASIKSPKEVARRIV